MEDSIEHDSLLLYRMALRYIERGIFGCGECGPWRVPYCRECRGGGE